MSKFSEEQVLDLIIESIKYVQKVKSMGMPSSAYSKALREPIYFLWETKKNVKKYDNVSYRSLNSINISHEEGKLVRDHAIPFKYVRDELLKLSNVTRDSVKSILNNMLHSCVITKEEDKILTSKGLRSEMPKGSQLTDILARYNAVGIIVLENK